VKRKTRWRFRVGSDVVLRCVCDGGWGGEWSGVGVWAVGRMEGID